MKLNSGVIVFNKILSIVMLFAFLSVQTQAATHDGLKAAFDELTYSLETEWDQKDKSFYDTQMKKFLLTLGQLQAKGLTQSQLMDFAKSEVKNAKVAKDLETAFTMVQINKMSPSEANQYVLETLKKSYSSGASWGGEVFIYIAVAALIVAAVVALANGNYTTTGTGGYYNGGYTNSCYYQDVYYCTPYCYSDYYYGYTCYDDCFWTSQYTCY
jgi:hypothetical protein